MEVPIGFSVTVITKGKVSCRAGRLLDWLASYGKADVLR